MRILFFGDSITQGFWSTDGGWVELIRRYYDRLALQDLKSNNQPEIFNLGVSGDTTRNLLVRIENEVKARQWPGDPLVVVISIGTNDGLFENDKQWVHPGEFEENLEKIVELLRPISDRCILVGNSACDETKTAPVFWGDFHYTNKELERSEGIIQKVSNTFDLSYVPIYKEFKSRLDGGKDLLADGLHPNDAGHQLIADKVLEELQKVLGSMPLT